MRTTQREVLKHFEITAENGDHFEINAGEVYTTALEKEDGTVTVFSNFWVSVPISYFKPIYRE